MKIYACGCCGCVNSEVELVEREHINRSECFGEIVEERLYELVCPDCWNEISEDDVIDEDEIEVD